ncbi:DUF2232 domain-containing protein [Synechococcus elongatus]|uniref:DUF2232 domain-containing protein n=1 Tax=Synechococcus elongatus PCC 11801 TaxID=2219813 RepID=A0AAN1QMJ5_SYNEL|nr:DUF2232 domain-containing protein [Synechococcus elongatus]AZB72107.1 DUF2232 domain-containing protein [Synechococcus elongatus PCC 11801]
MTIEPAQEPLDEDWDSWVDADANAATPVTPMAIAARTEPKGPLALVETAFMASAAALLWLVNFFFPLGPVLRVLFPLPIALLYRRWGPRSAWLGAIVASLLLFVLLGPTRGILFLLPPGCLGVLLGCCWQRRLSWGWSILLGGGLETIGFFFRLGVLSVLLGEDIWTYLTAQVTGFLEWLMGLMGWLGQIPLSTVQAVALVTIALSSLLYVLVVHGVAWVLFRRLGTPIPAPPEWLQTVLDLDAA